MKGAKLNRLKRHYYSLFDAATAYDCTTEDLAHFAEVGELTISIRANISGVGTVHTGPFYEFDSEKIADVIEAEGLFDLLHYDAKEIVASPNLDRGIGTLIATDMCKIRVKTFDVPPQYYEESPPAYISVPNIEYSKKEVMMYECPPEEARIYANLDTVLVRRHKLIHQRKNGWACD